MSGIELKYKSVFHLVCEMTADAPAKVQDVVNAI